MSKHLDSICLILAGLVAVIWVYTATVAPAAASLHLNLFTAQQLPDVSQ
ncbi:hypothetical protein PXK56_18195 [Phaeobacter gallaeciensis]|nr:hypothetical protein [Phaeobacter gallaeciensis]MDE4297118.1 hypothetical protein [Phaeobacter gallaeciensis]